MGKFDGILICSDLDGTFRAGADTVEVNSKAVKYFTDNGGKFTFTTGRMISHFYECNLNKVMNAPAALCNGGIIYDYEKERIIYEKRLDYTIGDFVDAIKSQLHLKGALCDFSAGQTKLVNFENAGNLSPDIRDMKPVKIVCSFHSADEADSFKAFALNNKFFCNSFISKSWSVGVEFNSLEATKGKSIEIIKNYIGNIHTSIGIGDYENDISLITHADIGVAVGNAVNELKYAADMVIKQASEYAIRDLIEIIEKKYSA